MYERDWWVSGRGIARSMTMTIGGVCGTVSEGGRGMYEWGY
jgi:hypothetical protein